MASLASEIAPTTTSAPVPAPAPLEGLVGVKLLLKGARKSRAPSKTAGESSPIQPQEEPTCGCASARLRWRARDSLHAARDPHSPPGMMGARACTCACVRVCCRHQVVSSGGRVVDRVLLRAPLRLQEQQPVGQGGGRHGAPRPKARHRQPRRAALARELPQSMADVGDPGWPEDHHVCTA